MAAGALLSRFATEIYSDPNITYIRNHFFDDRSDSTKWTPVDQANWERAMDSAYEEWVSTEKVFSYVPTVLSITLSMYAATLTSSGLSTLTNKVLNRFAKRGSSTRVLHVLGKKTTRRAARKTVKIVPLLSKFSWLGGWSASVMGIVHFLSWDTFFFTPIITKNWDLGTSASSMRYHEDAILNQLASVYQGQNGQEDNYYSHRRLFDFLNDDIHKYPYQEYQKEYLRQYCPSMQCNKEWMHISENKNKNFFNRTQGFFTHLRYSVFHLPVLFDESYSNISGVLNLTEVVEQKDGKDITRSERLLEEITDLDKAVQNYRHALNQDFQIIFNNWKEFFEPFHEWQQATDNFYQHLISIKDQLSFTEEDFSNWSYQSKGMLDAKHFGLRELNQSIHIDKSRLYLESQLLQLGVRNEIIMKLNDIPDSLLRGIERLLKRESQASLLGGPSNEYYSILGYLNLGLNPFVVNEFEKFDYQARINAYYLDISPVILDQLGKEHTSYIQELISFLEDQPMRQRAIYVFAANQRWDWTKIEGQYDNLVAKLGEEGYQIEEIQKEYRGNIQSLYEVDPYEDLRGAKYFARDVGQMTSLHKRYHGIIYYSGTEKLLIGIVCGKSSEELKHQIMHRNYVLGNLTFEPPRLFKDRPSFCGQLRHVHHSFSVEENGQIVRYRHLLDYVSKNVPTDENEVKTFWEQIEGFSNQAYDKYKAEEVNAFSRILSTYEDKSYRLTRSPSGDPYSLTRRKPYAQGIHQFEMDVVDYNLRVLVSVLPKYDQDFLTHVYEYVDDIMELSFYAGNRFKDLFDKYNENFYLGKILRDVSDDSPILRELNKENYRELYFHVFHHKIMDMENYIISYFDENPDLQDQKDAILTIVGRLLRNIQDSLSHSGTIEGWLPQAHGRSI